MARRTDAPLREEQAVREEVCVHDEWEVDLQWGLRENSETEGRETASRRGAALGACDPAPWLVANADEDCNASRFRYGICYRIVDNRIEMPVGSRTICGIWFGAQGWTFEEVPFGGQQVLVIWLQYATARGVLQVPKKEHENKKDSDSIVEQKQVSLKANVLPPNFCRGCGTSHGCIGRREGGAR